MVDRPRKVEGRHNRQAIERHGITVTLVDLERNGPGAVALRRVRHRFTRTSQIAAAVLDVLAFNHPITSHGASGVHGLQVDRPAFQSTPSSWAEQGCTSDFG